MIYKKLLLLALLLLLLPATASAYSFKVDGIYYYVNGTNATVTYGNYYNSYSGSVVIPPTVTYEGATYDVTGIGDRAFYECSSLNSVFIPESVTSIGVFAFGGCSALDTLNFNAVNCADFDATVYHPFYNLNISTINIGNSVKRIPAYFAKGLTKLSSVTIGNSVTDIGNNAFQGCAGLTSVDIPNSVTTIGNSAFQGCTGLTSMSIGNSVTAIENNTFQGCTGLASVDIPNSVTTIGNNAFQGCTGLADINIPNSITFIGYNAFDGTTWYTTWYDNQPDGLIYIGLVAFSYKGEMPAGTSIVIKEGTLGIAGGAFQNCTGPTDIAIPNSVSAIGDNAFQNCTSLTSVNLPNSVTSVGEMVFSGCSLDNITIGEGLTSAQEWNWRDSYWLRGVTPVYFDLTSFFDGCDVKSLTWNAVDCPTPEIDFEAIYDAIGGVIMPYFNVDPLFNGDHLENVTIGEQVKAIPHGFASNSQITEIKIPHSVTSIADDAFDNCAHLKTIDWQAENCECDVLGNYYGYPFENDTVSRINIGNRVKSIGYSTFFCCHVDTIVCHAILPPVIGGFDYSTYTDGVLCVPEGSLNAYRNAPEWSEFQNIITIGGGIIPGDVDGDQQVSIADVTAIVDLLLLGNATAGDYPAADVDGDGAISIADVTSILDIIL